MSNVQAPRSDRDGWKDINKPTAFNLNKRGHLGVVFTSQPSWAWGNKYPRLLQNQLTQEEIPIVHMSIARKSRMWADVRESFARCDRYQLPNYFSSRSTRQKYGKRPISQCLRKWGCIPFIWSHGKSQRGLLCSGPRLILHPSFVEIRSVVFV